MASLEGRALLFAGQGNDVSKTIRKLLDQEISAASTRASFACASEVLGYDLLDVSLNQPEKLKSTEFSQPAILVTSLATAAAKADAHGEASAAAGFSLGEYAALVHAGALNFQDGVRLVKARAKAMQEAAEICPQGMVTVIGLSDAKLKELCDDAVAGCANKKGSESEQFSISIANRLFPEGRVLSGHKELVMWVVAHAPEPKYGAQAANALEVAGAFHSEYMAPARELLAAELSSVDLCMPRIEVYSNVTGKPYTSVDEIRALLVQQLESPVMWEQTVKEMLSSGNIKNFVDCGPGMQLKSMIRRIDRASFGKTAVLDK